MKLCRLVINKVITKSINKLENRYMPKNELFAIMLPDITWDKTHEILTIDKYKPLKVPMSCLEDKSSIKISIIAIKKKLEIK
jgi:hypothetical protein